MHAKIEHVEGSSVSHIALIMAAGQGTRMKSTKPKVLHEILDTSLLDYVISAAQAAGCKRTLVVTGHKCEEVEGRIAHHIDSGRVEIVHQEQLIGTANTVQSAREVLKGESGKLIVLSGDVPLLRSETLEALIDACTGSAMTVLTAQVADPTGYGRILRDEYGTICGIVEEKDATEEQRRITEINTGIYCFDLNGLFERLEKIGNENAQHEYYLTDIVRVVLDEGLSVGSITSSDSSEAMGVNSRVQLAEASHIMQRRINEHWMTEGVTMPAPELCWIAPDVELEPDVTLMPMTILSGPTHIASGSVIGPDTRISNSSIGEGSVVDSSVIKNSEVGKHATIGPRAYVRPGCVLDDEVKVGTSVELKNVQVGKGTKIPHLSYIGDATIGAGVNIGAGSITCNYDGTVKHHTTIGDGAFIGSDTMLIAPVEVGTQATTGAASAIAHDVPAGALALERSEQKNVDGWHERKQKKEDADVSSHDTHGKDAQ